jgi:hypothetical protein
LRQKQTETPYMTSLKIHRCVLAYGFIEYRPFTIKTNRNSIYDPHITDRLYLMILYMSFFRFPKNVIFCSKYIGVSLRFYRKSPVCDQNWPKLHISWSLPPYSRSVILNGHVYEFLWVFKKNRSKFIAHAYGFGQNCQFAAKTGRNFGFLGREPHIPDRLHIVVMYMCFTGFQKNVNFRSKSIYVSLEF